MAEYYAVLSKAVAGLENNGADTRRAVYDKARNALIGQLKAIEPPLPTAEISRQRLELEEAIRRVEREANVVAKTATRAAAPVRAASVGRAQPERAARQSPQDVFRRAIQEAESADDEPAAVARATVAARVDDWSVDEQAEAPERPPQPARQVRAERAAPAPAQVPARRAETYLPSQGYVEEPRRPDEPRLAPDYDYEWDPDAAPRPVAAGPQGELPAVGPGDRRDRPKRQQRASRDGDEFEGVERRARPSSLPVILLIVLILVMVIGLAGLGWSQRAVIADLLSGFDSHQAAVPQAAPAPDSSAKDGESLLGSGPGAADTGQIAPDGSAAAAGDAVPAPASPVRVVTPGGATAPDNSAAPATLSAGQGGAATTDNVAAAPLVAQKATLYEEPVGGAATASGVVAINAAVTWSAAQTSDGPAIVGNVDIPDRGMKLKLTIRPNHDKTLPASQVVEVVVVTPPNFPGKGIRDIPRVGMKAAEDARAQPLIGASAKVADGFFWVALSGVAADMSANLSLLKQREWIDLPLLYESGQRAVVTIEKGTAGDRVFDQVLSAWAAGG